MDFDKLLIVFSLKVYLLYVLYLTDLRLYLPLLTQLNCMQKSSQRTISTISLPTSPSWINPKLHNIHVTPKLDHKAITNLDLLNKPGADCIPAVILMKCKLEILYQLNPSICFITNLVFQVAGKCRLWYLYLNMLGRGVWLKTTVLLTFLLWLVKFLKKL